MEKSVMSNYAYCFTFLRNIHTRGAKAFFGPHSRASNLI